ncbi:ArsR/SmtB family transcription factor [Lactococcus lactis]
METFKTLSNEYRLKILTLLKEPKKHFYNETKVDEVETGVCVGEIQKLLNLTQSTTSHYLPMRVAINKLSFSNIDK